MSLRHEDINGVVWNFDEHQRVDIKFEVIHSHQEWSWSKMRRITVIDHAEPKEIILRSPFAPNVCIDIDVLRRLFRDYQ